MWVKIQYKRQHNINFKSNRHWSHFEDVLFWNSGINDIPRSTSYTNNWEIHQNFLHSFHWLEVYVYLRSSFCSQFNLSFFFVSKTLLNLSNLDRRLVVILMVQKVPNRPYATILDLILLWFVVYYKLSTFKVSNITTMSLWTITFITVLKHTHTHTRVHHTQIHTHIVLL